MNIIKTIQEIMKVRRFQKQREKDIKRNFKYELNKKGLNAK